MIDWADYGYCKTCGAGTGNACKRLGNKMYHGARKFLRKPHEGRSKAEPFWYVSDESFSQNRLR